MAKSQKIAVVTGANKGIGLELVRQLANGGVKTILTSRDQARGKQAQAELKAQGIDVDFHQLDVASEVSVQRLADYIREKYGRLDILVNNAGIMPDEDTTCNILDVPLNVIRHVLDTNTYGALLVTRALSPLLKENGGARVLNVSSGLGQLSDMQAMYPAYSISKTALNAVTRQLASALKGYSVYVNAICPGWVRTDMGGDNAERSVQQSVDGIMPLLLDDTDKRTGRFMRDGKEIDW